MKIIHISPFYYPSTEFGGPIFSIYKLNNELAKNNKIIILTTTKQNLKPQTKKLKNQTIHYLSKRKFMKNCFKQIKQADIVHISMLWNFTTIISYLACKKYNKPYIISPRGSLIKKAFNHKKIKKFLAFNLIFKKIIKKAKATHFTSKLEKENSIYNKNSIIISNPLLLPLTKKKEQIKTKKQNYILYLGRFEKIKNLKLIIKTFKKIQKTNPNLKLILAGPNNKYKQKLKRKYQSKTIHFKPKILGKEKINLLNKAKILLLVSQFENFGNTALEALSQSTQVIVSKNTGIANEIKTSKLGLVINPNQQELENAINKLLKNPIKINQKTLKKYTPKNIATKFIKLYKKIK